MNNIKQFEQMFNASIAQHVGVFRYDASHDDQIDEMFEAFVAYVRACVRIMPSIAAHADVARIVNDPDNANIN